MLKPFVYSVQQHGQVLNVSELVFESHHEVRKAVLRNNTHTDAHITCSILHTGNCRLEAQILWSKCYYEVGIKNMQCATCCQLYQMKNPMIHGRNPNHL